MRRTCFIIPCYNEQHPLPVDMFVEYLETHPERYCLFVDDVSRDHTAEVFALPFMSKWIFNVEILFRVIHHYGKVASRLIICEHPVKKWTKKRDSKITLHKKIISFFEMFRIVLNQNKYKKLEG